MGIGLHELAGLLLVGVLAYLYVLPFVIARRRNHPQKTPILVVNLFLGWTLIGWVGVLAWSMWNFEPRQAND